MNWEKEYAGKYVQLDDAVNSIQSNEKVFVGNAAAMAANFANKLFERSEELKNVTINATLSLRKLNYRPDLKGHIVLETFYGGPLERAARQMGLGSYAPLHFSQLDRYFKYAFQIDVAILDVTPPDAYGFCNLSAVTSSIAYDVLQSNPRIILQINEDIPYVYGEDNLIHISRADMIIKDNAPLGELMQAPATEIDDKIANHVIDMVPDGACIQIGVGGTANAVSYKLECKKDLGIHTEMLTESMVYLAKKGIINGSKKQHLPGKMATAMGLGSKEMYAFMDRNPMIYIAQLSTLLKLNTIAANDNFVSLNNTLQIDLTGQACSESLGFDQISSTGGQLDFVRGSLYSKNGKSILMLPSTAKSKDGTILSRISAELIPGGAVTTPRTDIQYVATEYGCVYLWGQSAQERAKRLISIAHPDFRDELKARAKKEGIIV